MFNNAVTAETLDGVLDGVLELLPIVIPVAISFLAIRKGLSFMFDALRSA